MHADAICRRIKQQVLLRDAFCWDERYIRRTTGQVS
jgi:hypothetical protein